MADDPTSLIALGIAGLVFVERAFDRVMQFLARRRENGSGQRQALSAERGAAGNGPKAITQRLDAIESELEKLRTDCGNLWSKVSGVDALAQRLDERTGAKKG